jgi:hypothetical protein
MDKFFLLTGVWIGPVRPVDALQLSRVAVVVVVVVVVE